MKSVLPYLLVGVLMLLPVNQATAQEAERLAPQLELVSGVGLSYGQVVSLTPQVVFLGEYKNGWAYGPGIGLRSGLVTVSYMIVDSPALNNERDTQFETNLMLFYRVRYSSGRFFGAIDLGAAWGLLSCYDGDWTFGYQNINNRCRTQGLFVEPQAGVHLGRFSLSLGAMVYPSDYKLQELNGDIVSSKRKENDWAFALNLHFIYAL